MIINTNKNSRSQIFLSVLLCMSALSSMASDMYIAAFPDMVEYFSVSGDSAKWTISLFFIGLAISQLVYGPLSDYLGRIRVVLIGLLIFALGCVLSLYSKWFSLFLISRFIQGCGAGATTCISRAMLRDTFEGPELAKALSYVGMGMAIVPAIAPIIGSYVQHYYNWKCEFIFMLGFAIFLMLIVKFFIFESNIFTQQHKKGITQILGEYVSVFCDPIFLINMIVASIIVAMVYLFYSVTSFLLQNDFGWNEVEYGRIGILIAACMFAGRKINIILSVHFPNNIVTLIGCLMSLIAGLFMMIADHLSANILTIILPSIGAYALAGGVIFSNTFVGATKSHKQSVGITSSLYGVMQMTTVFLIISISTLLEISSIADIYLALLISSFLSVAMVLYLIRNSEVA